MPEKLMHNNAPSNRTSPPGGTKSGLRQPMALDGKRLNEKKPKQTKPKATYSNVLNNYESIRNMVTYPTGNSVEEMPGGKKKVSISV